MKITTHKEAVTKFCNLTGAKRINRNNFLDRQIARLPPERRAEVEKKAQEIVKKSRINRNQRTAFSRGEIASFIYKATKGQKAEILQIVKSLGFSLRNDPELLKECARELLRTVNTD